MTIDTEVLAQVWVGGDMGGLERAAVIVDRSDRDEIHLLVEVDGEEPTHIYLAPDRAVRLAQALIFQASKEWQL